MTAFAKDIVNDKVTLLTVVSMFAGITDVTDASGLVACRAVFTCPLTRCADCVCRLLLVIVVTALCKTVW